MPEDKRDGIETLLRAYSIVSDTEDTWLPDTIMSAKTEEIHRDPLKLKQFLDRFSNEKPFGDVLLEVISAGAMEKESIVANMGISNDMLEKILNNTILPNVIPLRKMITLLHLLHIPFTRAVESFRVSLSRYTVENSLEAACGILMRRKRTAPFLPGTGRRSKEALKRDLDAYIKRLLEEAG